jgi:cytochrome c5
MSSRIIAYALVAVIAAGCKTQSGVTAKDPAPQPTAEQAAAAEKRWAGVTEADLKAGRDIYVNRCTKCHENFVADKFTEKKWLHELDDMAPKAKLDAGQKEQLTRYILSLRDALVIKKM